MCLSPIFTSGGSVSLLRVSLLTLSLYGRSATPLRNAKNKKRFSATSEDAPSNISSPGPHQHAYHIEHFWQQLSKASLRFCHRSKFWGEFTFFLPRRKKGKGQKKFGLQTNPGRIVGENPMRKHILKPSQRPEGNWKFLPFSGHSAAPALHRCVGPGSLFANRLHEYSTHNAQAVAFGFLISPSSANKFSTLSFVGVRTSSKFCRIDWEKLWRDVENWMPVLTNSLCAQVSQKETCYQFQPVASFFYVFFHLHNAVTWFQHVQLELRCLLLQSLQVGS